MLASSYTVTQSHSCRIIDRPIPIDDFVALIHAWQKLSNPGDIWICDYLLAAHLGAAFIVGPESATRAWRAELGITPQPDDEKVSPG